MTTPASSPPIFWSVDASSADGVLLTYAIRGGASRWALLSIGGALLLGGLYSLYWLVAGGDLTVAGYVFLLVPAGVVLAGVYVLDIALLARTTYFLGGEKFVQLRHSLFGQKSLVIPRRSVQAVTQHYSPPGPSAPSGAEGDWTTFLAYQESGVKKPNEVALEGMRTPEEARWLGPLLAHWAQVPLDRGFGTEFDEADPAELPDISGGQLPVHADALVAAPKDALPWR
jgi:hypothetical protein